MSMFDGLLGNKDKCVCGNEYDYIIISKNFGVPICICDDCLLELISVRLKSREDKDRYD